MNISLPEQEIQSENTRSHALKIPEPSGMDRAEIESLALDVAGYMGFQPGDSDLPELVESIGGNISYVEYKDWIENGMNFIQIHGPGDFTVQLLSVAGPNQHNFTLAHELAHYIIHSESGEINPMKVMHSGEDRVEWEANIFALSFLMPEKDFRKVSETMKSDSALAGYFMVSFSAVRARKQILGIGAK